MLQFAGGTGNDAVWLTDEMKDRVLVHFLVDALPDAGLSEAAETLQSMVTYYLPSDYQPLLLTAQPIQAKIIGTAEPSIVPLPAE